MPSTVLACPPWLYRAQVWNLAAVDSELHTSYFVVALAFKVGSLARVDETALGDRATE